MTTNSIDVTIELRLANGTSAEFYQADEARAAASFIAPGREQDELLKKASKAERLASAADRLALVDPY